MSTDGAIIPGFESAATNASLVASELGLLLDRFSRGMRPSPPVSAAAGSPADIVTEVHQLEAEVLRFSRERAHINAENQLLNEIINCNGITGCNRLLRRLITESTTGFAALIDITAAETQPLAIRGDAISHQSGFRFKDRLIEQLHREPLVVGQYQFQQSGGSPLVAVENLSVLPKDPTQPARELFLVPIKLNNRLAGLLATTSLWPAGLRRSEQVEILGRISQGILSRCRQERELIQHQGELWIAREMLQLKSITDQAADQPLETLGEFTARLCEAAGMDRAAVFLTARREGDIAEPVVEAGVTLPATISKDWRRHEIRLVRNSVESLQVDILSDDELNHLGIDSLWGHAAVLPLRSAGKRLGTLILSRRSRALLPGRALQLLEWATDLLSQTLCRIYRDAAIRRQARHDGLTDLANRRVFDTLLTCEVDRVRLGVSEECSLLLADLDRFKAVNDQHGHMAGDEVLRLTAQLLRERVGQTRMGERSLIARYGGEELAVLLPGVGMGGALRVAEEIRAAIELMPVCYAEKRLGVTVSIGVASFPLHGTNAAELVAAADSALYQAKAEGRNRVCQPALHH
jgi:diguanylate cyclase (GGDEF)-like protein